MESTRRRRPRTATATNATSLPTPVPLPPPPPRRTRRRVASPAPPTSAPLARFAVASPGSAVLRVASPGSAGLRAPLARSAGLRVASPSPDILPSLDGATQATLLNWFTPAVAAEAAAHELDDDGPPPLLTDDENEDPRISESASTDDRSASEDPNASEDRSASEDPNASEDRSASEDPSANEDNLRSESDDLIPCEICSVMVPFIRYTDHVEDCLVRQRTRLRQRALASLPQMAIRRLTATDPHHDGLHIQLFAPAAQTQVASLFHQLGFQILADALSHDSGSGNDYEQNLALRDLLGDVIPPGLDNAAKEASTRPLDATAITGRDATCTICMDALPKADCARYRETPCRHVFCEPCLYRWLDDHHQCPNCLQSLRAPVPSENLDSIE